MSTYGEVRLRVQKLLGNSVDADVRDGWISDRYQAILDRLDWDRRDISSILQTSAVYETGTVAVTNGSTTVTGTGTTFTSAMTGRGFRITGDDEFYEFTYVSSTSGTLDRAYEGDTDTEATYKVFQSVYPMATDCKLIQAIASFTYGPLERKSIAELREMSPTGDTYGVPLYWALYMDDTSNRLQVQLYPVPEDSEGLNLLYQAEAPSWSTTSATLVPWLRPSAIIAGVQADAARLAGNLAVAESYENRYENYVLDMIRTEANLRGPQVLRVADKYRRRTY